MEMAKWFEHAQRADGARYVVLRDDAPEWLREAVQDAHDGEFPSDWRFEACWDLAGVLEELAEHGGSEAFDGWASEAADRCTEVYTAALLRWLADDLDRLEYVEEAREMGPFDSLGAELMAAQCLCLERMAQVLVDAWNAYERADEVGQ